MASISCSQPGRLLNKGVVLVYGQQNPEKLYLKAKSGGIEHEPARLELYSDVNYMCLYCEILFTNIKNIEFKEDKDLQITITKKDGGDVTFHACSDEATKEWIQYCLLLYTLPRYPIAETPKQMFVSKELISQYSDPQPFGAVRIWLVYILCEGIGGVVNITGLHILALDYHNHKFKLYEYETNKCLLTWDGSLIRTCGYIKSLVFMEAGRRCHGGPGLLWMQHPIPFSTELCKCLYRFLKIKIKVAPSCYTTTSIDSTEVAQYSVTRTTVQSPCDHQGKSPPQMSTTTHGSKAKDQRSSNEKCADKSSDILQLSELEKRAFRKCSGIISDKLDISAILPHLNAQGLLTTKDYQTLTNKHSTDVEKAEYLIYKLPRKSNDFFGKFMLCLCESKSGTGHGDIVKALTQLKAKLEKDNENNGGIDEGDPQQADEEIENEPYSIFIDLPDGVRSVKVKSSQTISSLMIELSGKLNIKNPPPEIEVDGDKVSNFKRTLKSSGIHRHSFIIL